MSDLSAGSATPREWAALLENAVQSHKLGGDHKYIAVHEGKEFQLLKGSGLKASDKKLSISKIVDTSKKELADLKTQYNEKKVSEEEYGKLSKKIFQYTDKLIDEREAKRNRIGVQILRAIAYVISAITSLVIVGIPFLVKLRKNETEFQQEIASLKETVRKPANEVSEVLKKNKEIAADVEKQIGRIPILLDEIDKAVTAEDRLKLLQKLMNQQFPKDENAEIVEQFEKDILRGVSFQRSDHLLYIEDEAPLPSPDLKGQDRLEPALRDLNRLLNENDADKRWRLPLQLIINQTCLNNIFDAAIGLFNVDAAMNGLMWDDPKTKTSYALKTAFSENLPPIKVEMVRNETTGEIEKVNVTVHGSLDIIKYRTSGKVDNKAENTDDEPEKEIIAPDAIEGNLTYTITLDDKGRPVVSNLESSLKAAQLGEKEKVA